MLELGERVPGRNLRGHGRDADNDGAADSGYDADEQLRRALEQERHCQDARRFFEEAPLYRTKNEDDGTVSLCRKAYAYWPSRPPAAATVWRAISNHPDLEQAERRLRHITSPHVYYDEQGRLARAPSTRWAAARCRGA